MIVAAALIVAVMAAARSTWSPCGLSMLSSITPFGEKARGHRYWATASWFLVGGAAWGCTLGGFGALASLGLRAAGPPRAVVSGLAAVLALSAAAVDAGVFGALLPVVRRQLDEYWLTRYRRWVYGFGFGWQIGGQIGLAWTLWSVLPYLFRLTRKIEYHKGPMPLLPVPVRHPKGAFPRLPASVLDADRQQRAAA